MSFKFVFEDEEDEEDEEEEFGFSFVFEDEVEDELGLSFSEEIPSRKRITDPEVQRKAQGKRKRRVESMSYDGKLAAGWSYFCAHKEHLPTLCEDYQNADKVTCSCPCHSKRGYVYQQPEYIPGSDDETILFIFD